MIIDCIGCLHGYKPKLEGGDLLIVSGDLTGRDRIEEYSDFFAWLSKQDYKDKVLIAGNHDGEIDKGLDFDIVDEHIHYLEDSGIEVQGLKIWGSPWTAWFKGINPKCTAYTMCFGCDTEDHLMDCWSEIPHDTDILVTHSPPYGILDAIPMEDGSEFHAGSKSLYSWLKYVERPRLHVFSHIHEGYGQTEHFPTYEDKMMISVNCSIMNARYKPVNAPIRVIL